MKNIILLSVIILAVTILQAQTNETLVIKSSNKGLYLDHKVTPKENFYSMGRTFNVHPKHIASFNGTGHVERIESWTNCQDTIVGYKLFAKN
jgi:hypothetical protein